ncbi:pyrroline-5-carboxylate reductase [Alkalihalobacillus sp. MEB130]|uniref:pyrroline-5-carboxylate reductase n=1 Tax=Alkalihalobacillus sp. MEB130 TaxID=2976704 RepID=UPI0028DF775B|nr:pyrroline-5-carboxylate reductase [Alkalihalobacillus sp. MEB130]MDT8859872.1 pyrroline-5-carboxylate reductase [Alkalihalobacillus sp. MEB130]
MLQNKTITFLGAGSMAEAIIGGLVRQQVVNPKNIIATNLSDQQKLLDLEQNYGIRTNANRAEAVRHGDIVVLAMKPKHVKEAIEDIQEMTSDQQLFVSVLAGIPTFYIEDLLRSKAGVVRTMPNTSAKVGASATAITKGAYATDKQLREVEQLFSAVGTTTIVAEDKLDAVTGLAGSGPAYFYYLVEAMEQAAKEAGLTQEEASALITQTIVGVGKRLQSTTKSSKELYEEVMSPNGTTEAGINVLREQKSQEAMFQAVTRAISRSKELGEVYTKTN